MCWHELESHLSDITRDELPLFRSWAPVTCNIMGLQLTWPRSPTYEMKKIEKFELDGCWKLLSLLLAEQELRCIVQASIISKQYNENSIFYNIEYVKFLLSRKGKKERRSEWLNRSFLKQSAVLFSSYCLSIQIMSEFILLTVFWNCILLLHVILTKKYSF